MLTLQYVLYGSHCPVDPAFPIPSVKNLFHPLLVITTMVGLNILQLVSGKILSLILNLISLSFFFFILKIIYL